MNRRGLTLLEVMVALVILGIVVGAYLELFSGAARGAGASRAWSQAVDYATDGMERAKLEPNLSTLAATTEQLPGGFARRVELRPWAAPGVNGAFTEIRVVVTLPRGGDYALARLVPRP